MMDHVKHIAVAFVALMAGGCVSLLPETAPPKPRYHITAPATDGLTGARLDWSLVVDDPRTTRVYDSVRIAVEPSPGKIEYFASAEWADRAPRLFQAALIQTFEDSGRILAVGDHDAIPVGDVLLQTDIRHMHFNVRNGGGATDVAVYARLGDGKGRVYAAKLFQASQAAVSDEADNVMAAFNGSFQTIIAEMVAWSFEQSEAALNAS